MQIFLIESLVLSVPNQYFVCMFLVAPIDSPIFVLYTLNNLSYFFMCKKIMRKLSYIVFREPSSLSKAGDQEVWFWTVKKMEGDLENLLKNFFFGLFNKFYDKVRCREPFGDTHRLIVYTIVVIKGVAYNPKTFFSKIQRWFLNTKFNTYDSFMLT